METKLVRRLSTYFVHDLTAGLLAPILRRVTDDTSLCMELRGSYINVYYRGGSLMKISAAGGGYSVGFDTKYFPGGPPPMPPAQIRVASDVEHWLAALPTLRQAMDFKGPGEEREVQQLLLRDNNFGRGARTTDYFVCDLEYRTPQGQFDFIGVRWISEPQARKQADGQRLVIGEIKCGDAALDGTSGLHAHVNDVNAFLATPGRLDDLKADMVEVFNQKRALGLIDCGKDLQSFSDQRPILLMVLVNHDPDTTPLRRALGTMPPSPHAEIRVATSSLLGFGLYDPGMLTVEQALARI